jgi:adenine-specific DNA-methyltransferase
MEKNNKLELNWIGKNVSINVEPRILIQNIKNNHGVSTIDNSFSNKLIYGDNLLGLKALEHNFSNKIDFVYIDPPYNINAAGVPFDDNIEHSQYLNLMKPRIDLIHKLLKDNGVFCLHCDDAEQAYLKIVCDEIFGRNSMMTMLVIETGEVFGTKAAHIDKSFVKVKDYIMIYVKNKNKNFTVKPIYTESSELFDSHYNTVINLETLEKQTLNNYMKNNRIIKEIFNKLDLKVSINNLSIAMNQNETLKKIIFEMSENIFQDQPLSNNIEEDFIENMSEGKVYRYNDRLIFKTSSGTIRYYHSFSNSLQITNDYDSSYTRSTARGDLWKNYHIDMRNISKEGGVIFKNSKKPERLIYDLLYAFTNPGDIVLDSFLGSGTTIAVAHKMNRKWIGIEMGEHQMFQLAKPRIDRIIDNKDQTGVTNRTNWNGGGAYRFYEVASSLVKFDEFEQPIINSDYNADMLAAAIALHEGYKYNPSQEVFWKQAHSSENSFLFVTTNHVNHQYLDSIYNQLEENEFLLISCKSFDSNIDKKYKNISIKKIPDSILKNCEFEKDNYNLNIINPPSYEEEDDYYE